MTSEEDFLKALIAELPNSELLVTSEGQILPGSEPRGLLLPGSEPLGLLLSDFELTTSEGQLLPDSEHLGL
jgi:hypothetical protein